MEFKIKVEVEGEWIVMDWIELNQSILFGNDLTNHRKRFWTGLKDKNGVEIYEGDILVSEIYRGVRKLHSEPFVMTWNHDRAAWIEYSPRDIFKIIGNIYENPGLLK